METFQKSGHRSNPVSPTTPLKIGSHGPESRAPPREPSALTLWLLHHDPQAIRRAGAKQIFLPKYSPDLNPIEQAFGKLKILLRKAAARTVEALGAAIAELLESFKPDECANCFRNAGYAST